MMEYTSSSGASSSRQRLCYCERPMVVKTAQTEHNFGRRFVGCENYKINRDCGYFEWVDPELYAKCKRVGTWFWRKHQKLLSEAKRCEDMVQLEVSKVKVEMERENLCLKVEMDKEIARYHKEVEIGEIKLHAVKKNYQTILACSWVICLSVIFVLLFGYTSSGAYECKLGRLKLN